MKNKNRKCIVQDISYQQSKMYLTSGCATYSGDLFRARIFNEDEIPEYLKKDAESKIIFLDTKEGFELLTGEIKMLDSQIPEKKYRLKEMEEGREKLYNANPEMLSKFIEIYNMNSLKGFVQVSHENEKRIIESIVIGN